MKKYLSKVLHFIVLTLVFSSCIFDKLDKEDPELTEEIYATDVSTETDWDYWIVDRDGGYLFVNEYNNLPQLVYYKPNSDYEGYTIKFDNSGLPEIAVINNIIFSFGNFNGNLMDISIVFPNGEIEIVRDVQTDANWNSGNGRIATVNYSKSDFFRHLGIAVNAVACGVGIATAATGVGIAIAAIGCTATAASLAAEFIPDGKILGISSQLVGSIATAAGCYNSLGLSCVVSLAGSSFSGAAYHLDQAEQQEEDIRVAKAALEFGYGDVQVTLTWDNGNDIDLHVVDPSGEEIWWDDKESTSGGKLDVDDINGYGPENIFWQKNQAPQGVYNVYVHHFSGSSNSKYTVLISAFGEMQKFTGTISPDQLIKIARFSRSGITNGRISEFEYDKSKLERIKVQ